MTLGPLKTSGFNATLVAALAALGGFACCQARGATIAGTSALVTQSDANQLETWLGGGPITLTPIFQHVAGLDVKTLSDFHAAVDGKGPTFLVMKLLAGTYSVTSPSGATQDVQISQQIIGGYDPQSWDSSSSFHQTLSNSDRTAFLFNLTTSTIQHQNSITQGITGSGQLQTFNGTDLVAFGGGYDLSLDFTLNSGPQAANFDYGGTTYAFNIVNNGGAFIRNLNYGEVEVFGVSAGNPASNTPGSAQDVPILPSAQPPGIFVFADVPSGSWVDPPLVSGFHYEMTTPGSLFTGISGFPTGFSNPFSVSTGSTNLGQFIPGQTLTFPGAGIASFDIDGISPLADSASPTAFPLQLTFSTPTADFTMQGIEAVPEPASFLAWSGLVLFGLAVSTRAALGQRLLRMGLVGLE